ncbi:hypothetical protein ACFLU6_09535 [Acidobacteriota bacterium]
MSISKILTIARFETRLLMRTGRFWVLTLTVLLLSFLMNLTFNIIHYQVSGLSGSTGQLTPEFSLFIQYMTLAGIYSLAVIWFAFDFQHKDLSSRVNEVLYSRPISNADLVMGKYFGVLLPIISLSLMLAIISIAVKLIPGWLEGPLLLRGHLVCLGLQALPSLMFMVALVFALFSLTRSRVVAIIGGNAVFIGVTFVLTNINRGPSAPYLPLFDIQGDTQSWIWSDLIGFDMLGRLIEQRIYLFAWIVLFLALSVQRFPRLKARRPRAVPIAAVIAVSAFVITGYIALLAVRNEGVKALRAEAKKEQQELVQHPRTMVRDYDINITFPGTKSLRAEVLMTLANDNESHLNQACFILNSGMRIDAVKASSGRPLDFHRGRTVLLISLDPPLAPGATTKIRVDYHGKINPHAIYLSTEFELYNIQGEGRHELMAKMGYIPAHIGRYTFLPGESLWYPVPNVRYGYTYPAKGPATFSTTRISVGVPATHEVISAGRFAGEKELGSGMKAVTWECKEPIPAIPLVCGPYRRIRASIGEIEFSLYYHKGHEQQVSFFADAAQEIKEKISERLGQFQDTTGLTYPFPELSVVEVPLQTRAYGEGWDMPNVLAQPGVILLRENGLFKANFKSRYRKLENRDRDRGEIAKPGPIKTKMLQDFFNYDLTGGNLEHNMLRNYWDFRIEGAGPLHALLDYSLGHCVAERASGSRPFHSVYAATTDEGQTGMKIVRSERQGLSDIRGDIIHSALKWGKITESMERTPLEEMIPSEDPELFFSVMTVKGDAFIRALSAVMGERFPDLLRTLMDKHEGGEFTFADFRREAETVHGQDLGFIFDQWLRTTRLPGFHLLSTEVYRIRSDDPCPAYQVIVHLRNSEDAAGMGWFTVTTEKEPVTQLLRFQGMEEKQIAVVVPDVPLAIRFESILAKNYSAIEYAVKLADEEKPERIDHTRTVRNGQVDMAIIVDDLDVGFSIQKPEDKGLMSALRADRDSEEYGEYSGHGAPNTWFEWNTKDAYGYYKHTLKLKEGGAGSEQGIWRAEIPAGGRYEVFVYIGINDESFRGRPARRPKLSSTFKYTVKHADGEEPVSLDTDGAEPDWNSLGEYYFESSTPAQVSLSDEGNGIIILDAVKFKPVSSSLNRRP